MKFLSTLIGVILFLVALAFALSNRGTATVNLWPFDLTMEAPLYLLTLGALLFGMLFGAIWVWLAMLPHHFSAQRLRKDVGLLHERLEELQRSIRPKHPQADLSMLPQPKRSWKFWGRRL